MGRKIKGASVSMTVLYVISGFVLSGCISGRSDVSYGPKGPAAGNDTLKHIQCGQTSKAWVLGALGTPTSETATPEGTDILKYEYTKKTKVDFSFCPFMDFDDKKEEQTTYFFEIRDGTVIKFWTD